MQVSDLGSPVSPQNLLAEHRQSSPEIDKLIQKTGDFNIELTSLRCVWGLLFIFSVTDL